MTGCHYKKCLWATSFIEPSQVPPTVGFGGAASPAQPHQAQAQPAGTHCASFVSAEQEAKQNKTFKAVFCQPTHIKQTVL